MTEPENTAQGQNSGAAEEAVQELDARGLYCPEPVMLLHKKVRELAAGELLRVYATDPSTTRDIPKFCHFLGHSLLSQQEEAGNYEYLIRKADSDSP